MEYRESPELCLRTLIYVLCGAYAVVVVAIGFTTVLFVRTAVGGYVEAAFELATAVPDL